MAPKQTLPDQHLLLEQRWPSDCCLCHHEAENAALRAQLEEAQAEGMGLQESLTVVGEQLQETQAEVEALEAEREEHRQHAQDKAAENKRLERTLARAQRIIGLLHIERGELIERLAALCGEEE